MKRQLGDTNKQELLERFACCGNCIFFNGFEGDPEEYPRLKNSGHCYVNPPTPVYDIRMENIAMTDPEASAYVSIWPKTSIAAFCHRWIEDIEDLEKAEWGNLTKDDFRKFIRGSSNIKG